MYLRDLNENDSLLMHEWMNNNNVVENLKTDFSKISIEDCRCFVKNCKDKRHNVHYAIASDEDDYMGTVSLKNIDSLTAEFAIVVRESAMGKGYSWFGMTEILKIGFEKMNLEAIYWCVSKNNKRAIGFYDKHHFHEALDIPKRIRKKYEKIENLKWYSVLQGDDYTETEKKRGAVAGCKVLNIKTIPTVNAGELSFFESEYDVPFVIKRFYYISKVPECTKRGFHAHKELKQLLFCPYGKIQIVLDDGKQKGTILLSDPSTGIIIDHPVWREMLWLEKNSVLCVAASDYYGEEDYLRDYNEFLAYLEN